MTLGEKVRSLRSVEGDLRGLGREMSQQEVAAAIHQELGESFSQSYLSQIESGARPHLTHNTRLLLARFFKVHPGFLVDDPEGFHTELVSDLRTTEGRLDVWLLQGSERFASDREVSDELFGRLRAFLSPEQVVSLTALGGLMVATNLFNNALKVDLDGYLDPFRKKTS